MPRSSGFNHWLGVFFLITVHSLIPRSASSGEGVHVAAAQFVSTEAFAPADGKCGDKGPWTEGMCYTDGQGVENEHCKRCLVGEQWDALRAKLGTHFVKGNRSTVPVVKYGEWLSSTMLATVFRILLKEMLGYEDVRTVTTTSSYFIQEAAAEHCKAISFESWFTPEDVELQYLTNVPQKHKAMRAPTGVKGREALYVPAYMPTSAAHYRSMSAHIAGAGDASSTRAASSDHFTPDGSFGLHNLSTYFPGGDPWGCSTEEWTVSNCNTGRWYPPQCGDTFPSETCSEMLLAQQDWSGGWFEAVAKNLGLNLSSVYTSYEGQLALVERLYAERQGFLFYWWDPDPLLVRFPVTEVTLPRHSRRCEGGYDDDPALSEVDCELSTVEVEKFINANMPVTDPDLFYLWDSFWLENGDVSELMGHHRLGGGNHSDMYGAACGWLRESVDTVRWDQWLRVHDRCPQPGLSWDESAGGCVEVGEVKEGEPPADGEDTVPVWLVIVLVVSLIVLQLLLLALYIAYRKHRNAGGGIGAVDNFAPPGEGEMVTLVITDIQGSTSLWDSCPKEMAAGIDLHHKILRAALKECHGYEVATEGDSFKCAFSTPEEAICWSAMVQMDLLAAPWGECIEDGGAGAFFRPGKWADTEQFMTLSDYQAWDKALKEGDAAVVAGGGSAGVRKVPFNIRNAALTGYSRLIVGQFPGSSVIHSSSDLALPAFRGLRVRIGMHTGVADIVLIHENTKRVVYGGEVADVAKAISDVPCGGQILASGETIAAISSMHGLQQQVQRRCGGWFSVLGSHRRGAALSIVHMGSHIVDKMPWSFDDSSVSTMPQSFAGHLASARPAPSATNYHSQLEAPELRAQDSLTGGRKAAREVTNAALNTSDNPRPPLQRRRWSLTGLDVTNGAPVCATETRSYTASRAPRPPAPQPPLPPPLTIPPPPRVEAMQRLDVQRASGYSMLSAAAAEELQTDAVNEYAEKLELAVELVEVVPMALRARQRTFPPLDTIEMLSPGFYEAPSARRVTILFTMLDRWQNIKNWSERHPARKIILQESKSLVSLQVRGTLHEHAGYEVEGEDGCFVCAFHTPEEAVEFGVELQRRLLEAAWSPEILRNKHCRPVSGKDGQVVLRGPRVKVGMCTADAEQAQPSPRTGRMEYFGPIMNHAARVANTAYGGQVLLHEATLDALDRDLLPDDVSLTPVGWHCLKGMRRAIRIAQASCPGCKENFPELCPGTGDAKLLPMVENVSSRGKGSSRGVANRNASLRAIRPRIAGGGSPSPTSSAAPPRNLDSSINSLERDSDSGQGQRLSDPEVNSTPFNLWTTLSMRTIRTPSSLSDYDAEADDIAGSNERASSSKVSGSTA